MAAQDQAGLKGRSGCLGSHARQLFGVARQTRAGRHWTRPMCCSWELRRGAQVRGHGVGAG
eukprot:scaffold3139_cov110-Isochrysis_galbana.AAC.3